MAKYAYERLPAHDASFLVFENPNVHMHISWTWIFDAGSVGTGDGGVDIARLRRQVAARLLNFPRFRQRLAYTPIEAHPGWIDDPDFNLNYHVRHASLPHPGDEAALKGMASAIISQPLDLSKPLWEMWIVEGMADGRFAVVTKTHHCMVDGVSTVDLMTGLLDRAPQRESDESVDWIPRPSPGAFDLVRESARDRIGLVFSAARRLGIGIESLLGGGLERAGERLGTWRDTLVSGVTGATPTPLNRPVGPHRLVNWIRFSQADVDAAARHHGGSDTDVVLTTIAGAIGRFFRRADFQIGRRPFRVVVPRSTRFNADPGVPGTPLGNQANGWICTLPVAEPDPVRRFRSVARTTRNFKESNQALGLESMLEFAEVAGNTVFHLGVALSRRLHAYNLIVTRIPGPNEPRYLLDARMVDAYPQVPLFENQSMAIAVARHLDHVNIGVTADWESIPNLRPFIDDLRRSFAELAPPKPAALPAPAVPRKVPRRTARSAASRGTVEQRSGPDTKQRVRE